MSDIWTEQGKVSPTLERLLAHEIGHAATGLPDYGSNNNWKVNENPIVRELGQPVRTRY